MASAGDEACALQKALGKSKIRDNYVYSYQNASYTQLQWVQFDETSIQSLRDSRMKACSLAAIIWTSGQAVMDQKKWHTISMLA